MAFRLQSKGFATRSIHVGQEPEQRSHQSVVPPLVMSTTFKQPAPAEPIRFSYSRSSNPTRNVLEKCLASLDNGKYGLAFSSGLGAITTVTQLLSAGDHFISCYDVYSSINRQFTQTTARQGIEVDFVDASNLDNLEKAIKNNTRLIWLETPSNPCMNLLDIAVISALAHSYENILVVVDNTFMTPYFQRPLELGADIAVYSIGKYINGHSDVIMGSVTVNDEDLYKRLKFLQTFSGIIPSPFDCYQVNRSLKTLSLRMEQHWKSSLVVAKFLESHPYVERVLYPGLPSHPQYELMLKQAYGHGGIMSFYIAGGLKESRKFLQSLKVVALAESLGGCESVAELPSIMTHACLPENERLALGITHSLIRLSVGLEDAEDIVEDIKQALEATFKKAPLKRFGSNYF